MKKRLKLELTPQERQSIRQRETYDRLRDSTFRELLSAAEEVQNTMVAENDIEKMVMRRLFKAITKVSGIICFLLIFSGCTTVTFHIGEKVSFDEPYIEFNNSCVGAITHGPLLSKKGTYYAISSTCGRFTKEFTFIVNENSMRSLNED